MQIKETIKNVGSKVKEKAVEAKDKAKTKAKDVWTKNKETILISGFWIATVGGVALYIANGFRQQNEFNASIREMYGPTATEGNIFGGPVKKRWAAHKKWEEEGYKDNFDKVYEFVKTLDLKDDEYFSIERCVGENGGLVTEVMQMGEGGFYHGDLI